MTKLIDFSFAFIFWLIGFSSLVMSIVHQRGDFMFYAIACSIMAWLMFKEYQKSQKAETNNA